jgi:hypothetical protein
MKQPIKVKWVLVPLDMRQIRRRFGFRLYSIMNNPTLYFVLGFTKEDYKRQIWIFIMLTNILKIWCILVFLQLEY